MLIIIEFWGCIPLNNKVPSYLSDSSQGASYLAKYNIAYHRNNMYIISLHLACLTLSAVVWRWEECICVCTCRIIVLLSFFVYLCVYAFIIPYRSYSLQTHWVLKQLQWIQEQKMCVGPVWSSTLYQVMNLYDRRPCSVTGTTCMEGFICSQSELFQCPLIFHSTVLSWFQTLTHKSLLADHAPLWVSLSFIRPGTFKGSDAGQQYWHTYLGACGQHPPFLVS